MDKVSDLQNKLDTDDDLELPFIDPDNLPDDILFPLELIPHLRGQVQFLSLANERLKQSLAEKTQKIEENEMKTIGLNKKISEYEVMVNDLSGQPLSVNSTRLISTKIVDLSKKLREKNSELEGLRTKYSKLKQSLMDLEIKKTNSKKVINTEVPEIKNESKYVEELKILQEKLNNTTNKFFETKNHNTQLKNDLKLANKILQQELGDNFTTLQNFMINNYSNWRGRAQQIIGLQQKNSELLEKISNLSDKDVVVTPNKPDNRKIIIEQLNKELTSIKTELEETKKKLNGARARIKVMESECVSLKSRATNQAEKITNDEQIINLLKNQVASLEESQNSIYKDNQMQIELQSKNLNMELSKERCKLENMKKTLMQKENKITELHNELHKRKNSASSLFVVPKEISTKLNILEVEAKRLLELVAVLNNRLGEERNLQSELQQNYRKERQRAAKLETKILRMEMENNLIKTQAYSKSLSKVNMVSSEEGSVITIESVKNSLELAEENIKTLEARLIILQREKDLDFQRFGAILNDRANILKIHEGNN